MDYRIIRLRRLPAAGLGIRGFASGLDQISTKIRKLDFQDKGLFAFGVGLRRD
jgi:hypothetical protein